MLQCWILNYITKEKIDKNNPLYLDIDYREIMYSIIFASAHFLFEILFLWSEAKAVRTDILPYVVVCLNAR